MENQCKESASFFLNCLVHILILLCIISSFYFFYVADLSRSTFRKELQHEVEENVAKKLSLYGKSRYIEDVLNKVDFDKLIDYYSQDADKSKIQNAWLRRVTLVVIVSLVVLLLVSGVLIKRLCPDVSILDILRENLIVFTLVGIVEVLFFLKIAKNFIPSRPSLLVESIIRSIQNNFK